MRRLAVTFPSLLQTSPSVSESTKASSRGMTLPLLVFSENFHERRICKTLSSVIAQPELSNASASQFAPFRERFCLGVVSGTKAHFRVRPACWQRRGRFVGLGPSIAQKLNKDRAVGAEARTNKIAEREISPEVVQEQSPSRIWQPVYQNDAA